MKVNWTGKRWSVHWGVFVVLLQLCFLTSMLNIHAFGASSGVPQSIAEHKTIYDDPRLLEALNGNLMTSVRQNGYAILIEAENGCEIRGSIRDGPAFQPGWTGLRKFFIADLKVERGCDDEVTSPKNCETTSASRLQDFRNMFKSINKTHGDLFRTSRIDHIEMIRKDTFRISSDIFGYQADIPYTPSGCVPIENDHDHSML